MDRRPSIIRIILNDYLAFLGAAVPVITSAMFYILANLNEGNPLSLVYIGAAISIAGFVTLVWRMRLISAAFAACVETQATITAVNFFRDRGQIEYHYTHQGQPYTSGNAVMKNRQTQALEVGQKVTVVVDSDHPRQAFIRDLYSSAV